MALTTIAGINDALPGQRCTFQKPTAAASPGGVWLSFWTVAGLPGQGAAPSPGLAGAVPTKATTGAMSFVNPASGNTYLGGLAGRIQPDNTRYLTLAVYDRLWHNSGIDATITTGQTISANDAGAVHLTRPSATAGSAEAWFEVYVVMGSGTPTVTLAYTDQDGNPETTGSSGALSTTMVVGRTGQFQLATGDTGVRSIQTWTASATFTSGTIGLVIRRMVAQVFIDPLVNVSLDALALALPRVYDDACLECLWMSSNGSNTIVGSLNLALIQG